jgi:hypothetical protein
MTSSLRRAPVCRPPSILALKFMLSFEHAEIADRRLERLEFAGQRFERVDGYGRSRDVDEIDKAMEFNRETCRWTILGENSDVSRSREQQEVLDALDTGPKALKDIALIVGKSVQAVCNLLERMAKQGKVTRTERGIYTRVPKSDPESVNESVNAETRWWQ